MQAISRGRFITLYVVICLIWGSTWVVIRIGDEAALPPFLGAALRFVLAAILLWSWVLIRKTPLPKGRKEWMVSIANGILGSGMSYAIVYWCSQFIPSGLEAVIFGTMPLWTIFLGHIIFRSEKLSMRKLAGILLGIGGTLLIFLPSIGAISTESWHAMIYLLAAPMVSALSLVLTKRYAQEIAPIALNAVSIGIGAIILSIIAICTVDLSAVHFNFTEVWTVVYLATLGTVTTFVTYYRLLKHASAVTISYVSLITPVLAVLLGWLILHEHLNTETIEGSVLVLGGIWMTLWERSAVSALKA
ncbi:MAG: EamA family transporter [Candidatus Kapaibacterium sp.]